MWKEQLKEIIREEQIYGEQINSGISENELKKFEVMVRTELNVDVPEEYAEILKVVNGLEFNGFIIYGVDSNIIASQQNQRIYGLIENNKIWYENEWQKKYIFLGESNISWYVYDLSFHKYLELDKPSGNQVEIFENIDSMLEKIFTDALEN